MDRQKLLDSIPDTSERFEWTVKQISTLSDFQLREVVACLKRIAGVLKADHA